MVIRDNHPVALDVLERDGELGILREALAGAAHGRGATVLISGEAGIGKTTLVRAFANGAGDGRRLLIGACDDLLTPRVLGPFRDMALDADGLRQVLGDGGEREAVLSAVLDELSRAPGPNIMVVEDLHWADDATLDAVRFLARRIEGLRALLILTYRDDELTPDHQLQRVLSRGTRSDAFILRLCRWRAWRFSTPRDGSPATSYWRGPEVILSTLRRFWRPRSSPFRRR